MKSCTSKLISTGKFVSWVDWLDTFPTSYQSLSWSSQFVSLRSQSALEHTNGRSALWSSSGYRTTSIFLFVSWWLKSKLKVKRLISCRNSYEECVLPGISTAILSFPCVKGVKCFFGSREYTWPLMTRLQTVQRLFSEQNWFILFSHVPARRYDQQVKYCCPQEIFFLKLLWNQSS